MRDGLSKDLITRVLGAAPKWTLEELEAKFPPRQLEEGAFVTRFAPSPTGFMHIGNLYGALIDYKLAQQSNGVFMLRIEDTDTKREVSGAVEIVKNAMASFGLQYNNDEKYGPYYQSKRKDIYHSVAAYLLEKGLAYPCFLKPTEMDEIRKKQTAAGFATGIYGEFARDRDLTDEEIIAHLDNGEVPSIRLYSNGNPENRIYCKDAVRGSISFPENNEDLVLIKSNDGLPTYHFAHLVDDHFMRTTHVVRGEEWLPSLPLHYQLFRTMGWMPPLYIHTSTLDKIDSETGKQRKMSKRKDAECNVDFFLTEGWPTEAVIEYLGNILASGYEDAKMKGMVKNYWEYEMKPKKIPMSGALFDMKKLEWWAKEAKKYGSDDNKKQIADIDYLTSILSIERDNPKRIRKDFITWKQTLNEIAPFFDFLFVPNKEYEYNTDALREFIMTFDENDDKDAWWQKIVCTAEKLGLKPGEVAMNLRVAVLGRTNTPDLYSVMQVLGGKRVRDRIGMII